MMTIPLQKFIQVRKMYEQEGKSAREIAAALAVSIDAVYAFMRKHKIERRSPSENNTLQFQRRALTFTLSGNLSDELERLRMLAVTLYWGEGAKTGHTVDFANSDVDMCRLFLRFLREVCQVDERKIRGYLYCHHNQDANRLLRFWSRALKIPLKQFTKPYVRRGSTASKRVMEHGLLHIRYADLKLLRQLLSWIEEYKHLGR